MAEDESPNDGPSLELPSFGLRRKKKAKKVAPEDPPTTESAEPEPPTEVMPPPLFADEVEPEASPAVDAEPEPQPDPDPEPGARKKKVKKERGPGGYPAAALTGLVVGVLMVAATWGALNGCEAVRGTSSCGQPGFIVLLVMLVLAVLVGSILLKAFRVRDPGSTSFLGVGLVTVVALIGFIDVIYDWWMFLVIPGVGLISFALAHAVTSAFVDTSGDDRHR